MVFAISKGDPESRQDELLLIAAQLSPSIKKDGQGSQFSVFTQLVLAVAMLSEEHLGHPLLLITTPIIDFHLPGSASVTCLIAPQPVLK